MSDTPQPPPRLPAFPERPDRGQELVNTEPPEEHDTLRAMQDLRGMLTNVGSKMAELETYLLRQELAIRTEEAQIHRAHERLDEVPSGEAFSKLADRVQALEDAVAAE